MEDVVKAREGFQFAVEAALKAQEAGEVISFHLFEGMIVRLTDILKLAIAACILPDKYLPEPIIAYDTRKSEKHPLRHSVLNLIAALAEKSLLAESASQVPSGTQSPTLIADPLLSTAITPSSVLLSTSSPLLPSSISSSTTPSLEAPYLRNGDGYQLTNRTLYITHEPCLMCTMALVHARVKEVFFLHPMSATGGCGGVTLVPGLKSINHRFNVWRWKKERLSEVWTFEGKGVPTHVDA